jgi:hypothetical protein
MKGRLIGLLRAAAVMVAASCVLACLATNASAQSPGAITGTVTDRDGKGIPDVSIYLENGSVGTLTERVASGWRPCHLGIGSS